MNNQFAGILNNEKGSVLIMSTLALVALLGFAALAIDITHLTVVKNELQDAADAGALAGAAVLFNSDDTINGGEDAGGADAVAVRVATSNMSDQQLIDATEVEVKRGHWSLSDKKFRENDSLFQFDGWETMISEELDAEDGYINAVQVKVSRNDIAAFFANVLGLSQFLASADAVAYIGFAGDLEIGDVDLPIVLCEDAIINNEGGYSCNMGRMTNSSGNDGTGETGGWTDFTQGLDAANGCPKGAADADAVKDLSTCGPVDSNLPGNPNPISFGKGIATLPGEANSALKRLINCWIENVDIDDDGEPDIPWNMNLLVAECGDNNIDNCVKVTGVVNVDIIWINEGVNASVLKLDDIPLHMKTSEITWDRTKDCTFSEKATPEEIQECWKSFTTAFNLENVDGSSAPYQNHAIYFKPNCTPKEPTGGTSGDNYGIHAKYPVLVE